MNISRLVGITGQRVRPADQDDLGHQPRRNNRVFASDGLLSRGGQHTLLLDRDVSAALVITMLGVMQLVTGERPQVRLVCV